MGMFTISVQTQNAAAIVLGSALALGGGSSFAAIIHVPADYPTIQAGIDAAVDGDEVLVADGVYTGDGNRDLDFHGKPITVRSNFGRPNCIIDCDGTVEEPHRGFYFHSGETADSVAQGFRIRNGLVIRAHPFDT